MHCPYDLNNTLSSERCVTERCVIENSSHCENSGWNIYSKDKKGDEEPPIAWVQLAGQLVVMSLGDLLQQRVSTSWLFAFFLHVGCKDS